jgi:hypothetical protein
MLPFIYQIVAAIHKWRGITPDPDRLCDDETYKMAAALAVELGTETYVFTQAEPVLGVITPGESWVVTNCYDARCLVTQEIVILDVDIAILKDCDIRECNSSKGQECRQAERTRLADILNRYEMPFRLYETACGHRVVIQEELTGPLRMRGEMYDKLTAELNVDPKYLRISKEQGNFRARLDTKPWRTGGEALPGGSVLGDVSENPADNTMVIVARLVAWGRQGVEELPGVEVVKYHDKITGADLSGTEEWLLA